MPKNELRAVRKAPDGRGHKEKVYYCKKKEHTITKDPPKYDGTGALRVTGETIQFRDGVFRTNRASIQKYIEATDDFGVIIFMTPEEAGLYETEGEKVLTVMGANAGDMTPTEKGIKEGGQRTYKATDAQYEEPAPGAPEDLPE